MDPEPRFFPTMAPPRAVIFPMLGPSVAQEAAPEASAPTEELPPMDVRPSAAPLRAPDATFITAEASQAWIERTVGERIHPAYLPVLVNTIRSLVNNDSSEDHPGQLTQQIITRLAGTDLESRCLLDMVRLACLDTLHYTPGRFPTPLAAPVDASQLTISRFSQVGNAARVQQIWDALVAQGLIDTEGRVTRTFTGRITAQNLGIADLTPQEALRIARILQTARDQATNEALSEAASHALADEVLPPQILHFFQNGTIRLSFRSTLDEQRQVENFMVEMHVGTHSEVIAEFRRNAISEENPTGITVGNPPTSPIAGGLIAYLQRMLRGSSANQYTFAQEGVFCRGTYNALYSFLNQRGLLTITFDTQTEDETVVNQARLLEQRIEQANQAVARWQAAAASTPVDLDSLLQGFNARQAFLDTTIRTGLACSQNENPYVPECENAMRTYNAEMAALGGEQAYLRNLRAAGLRLDLAKSALQNALMVLDTARAYRDIDIHAGNLSPSDIAYIERCRTQAAHYQQVVNQLFNELFGEGSNLFELEWCAYLQARQDYARQSDLASREHDSVAARRRASDALDTLLRQADQLSRSMRYYQRAAAYNPALFAVLRDNLGDVRARFPSFAAGSSQAPEVVSRAQFSSDAAWQALIDGGNIELLPELSGTPARARVIALPDNPDTDGYAILRAALVDANVQELLSSLDQHVATELDSMRAVEGLNPDQIQLRYSRAIELSNRLGSGSARGALLQYIQSTLQQRSLANTQQVLNIFGAMSRDGYFRTWAQRAYENNVPEAFGFSAGQVSELVREEADMNCPAFHYADSSTQSRVINIGVTLYQLMLQHNTGLNEGDQGFITYADLVEQFQNIMNYLLSISTGAAGSAELRAILSILAGTTEDAETASYELSQRRDQAMTGYLTSASYTARLLDRPLEEIVQPDDPDAQAAARLRGAQDTYLTPRALHEMETSYVQTSAVRGLVSYEDLQQAGGLPEGVTARPGDLFFFSPIHGAHRVEASEAEGLPRVQLSDMEGVRFQRRSQDMRFEPLATIKLAISDYVPISNDLDLALPGTDRQHPPVTGRMRGVDLRGTCTVFGERQIWTFRTGSLQLLAMNGGSITTIANNIEQNPAFMPQITGDRALLAQVLRRAVSGQTNVRFTTEERQMLERFINLLPDTSTDEGRAALPQFIETNFPTLTVLQRQELQAGIRSLRTAFSTMQYKHGLTEDQQAPLLELAQYLDWVDSLPDDAEHAQARRDLALNDHALRNNTPPEELLCALRDAASHRGETFDEAHFSAIYTQAVETLRELHRSLMILASKYPPEEPGWEGSEEVTHGLERLGLHYVETWADGIQEAVQPPSQADMATPGLSNEMIIMLNLAIHPELAGDLQTVNSDIERLRTALGVEVDRVSNDSTHEVTQKFQAVRDITFTIDLDPSQADPARTLTQLKEYYDALLMDNQRLPHQSRIRAYVAAYVELLNSIIEATREPRSMVAGARELLNNLRMLESRIQAALAGEDQEFTISENNDGHRRDHRFLTNMQSALPSLGQALEELVNVCSEQLPLFNQLAAAELRQGEIMEELQRDGFTSDDWEQLQRVLPGLAGDEGVIGRVLDGAVDLFIGETNRVMGPAGSTHRTVRQVLTDYFADPAHQGESLSLSSLMPAPGDDHATIDAQIALSTLLQRLPTEQTINWPSVIPVMTLGWGGRTSNVFSLWRDVPAFISGLYGNAGTTTYGPINAEGMLQTANNAVSRNFYRLGSTFAMAAEDRPRQPLASQVIMLLAQSQIQSIRDRYAAILAQGNGSGTSRNALEVINRDIMRDLLQYLVEEVLPQLTSRQLQARVDYLLRILHIPLSVDDLMLLRNPEERQHFLARIPETERGVQLFDAQHTEPNAPLYGASCLVETLLRIAGELNQQRSTDDIELRPMAYFDPIQTYQRRCARYQNVTDLEPPRRIPVVHYEDSPAAGAIRDALPSEGFFSDLGDDITHYTPEVLGDIMEDFQSDWTNFFAEMARGGVGFALNLRFLMQRNIELGFTNISRGLGQACAAGQELTAARQANDQRRIQQAERRLYQALLGVITGLGRTTASFLTFELTPGFFLELRNMIRNHEPGRAIGYLVGLVTMTFSQIRASADIIRALGARGDAVIQGGRVRIRGGSWEDAKEMYRARMAERTPVHIGGTGVRLLSYHLIVPIFIDAYKGVRDGVATARHAARYLSGGLEVSVQSASSQFELVQESTPEGNRGAWVDAADFTVRAQDRFRQFRRSLFHDGLGAPQRVVDETLGRLGSARAVQLDAVTEESLVNIMRDAWQNPDRGFELSFGRNGRTASSIRVSGETYRRLVEAVARGDHATFRSLIAEHNRNSSQPFNEASIPQLFDAMQSQATLMLGERAEGALWCPRDMQPADMNPGQHRRAARFNAREFLQEARSGRRRMGTQWDFSFEVPDPTQPGRTRTETHRLSEAQIMEVLYRHLVDVQRVPNPEGRAEQAQRYIISQAVDEAILNFFRQEIGAGRWNSARGMQENMMELTLMVQRAGRGILFGHQEVGVFGRFRRGGRLYLDRALNPSLLRRFWQGLRGNLYTFEPPRYRSWRGVHDQLMRPEYKNEVRRYAQRHRISKARARIRLAQHIYGNYVIDRTECVLETMRNILEGREPTSRLPEERRLALLEEFNREGGALRRNLLGNHFQEVVQMDRAIFSAALSDLETIANIAELSGSDGAIARVFEQESVRYPETIRIAEIDARLAAIEEQRRSTGQEIIGEEEVRLRAEREELIRGQEGRRITEIDARLAAIEEQLRTPPESSTEVLTTEAVAAHNAIAEEERLRAEREALVRRTETRRIAEIDARLATIEEQLRTPPVLDAEVTAANNATAERTRLIAEREALVSRNETPAPETPAAPAPETPAAPAPTPLGESRVVGNGTRAVIMGPEGTSYVFTLRNGMTCETPRDVDGIRYFDFKTSEGYLVESYRINPESGVLEPTGEGAELNERNTRALRAGLNRELNTQAREAARLIEYRQAVSNLGEATRLGRFANDAEMEVAARNGLEALGRISMQELLGRLNTVEGRAFMASNEGLRFRAWLATPEARTAMLQGPASFAIGILSIIGIEGLLRLLPDNWINSDSAGARSARFVLILGSTHIINAASAETVRSLLTRGTGDASLHATNLINLLRRRTRAVGLGFFEARYVTRTATDTALTAAEESFARRMGRVSWRAFGQHVIGLESLGRLATGMGGMWIAGHAWDSFWTEVGVGRDSALRGEVAQFIASWGLPMVASAGRRLASFLLTRAGGAAAAELLGPLGTFIEIYGLAFMAIDLAYTFTTTSYQQSLDTRLNEVLRAGAISLATIRARVPGITNATIHQLFTLDPNGPSAGDDSLWVPRDNFETLVRNIPATQQEALRTLYQECNARLAAMGWDTRHLRPLLLSSGFIGREQLGRALRHEEEQADYDRHQAAIAGQSSLGEFMLAVDRQGESGAEGPSVPLSEAQAHTIISAYSSMLYRDLETSEQVADYLRTQINALRRENEPPEEFSARVQQMLGQRINFTSREEEAYAFVRQVMGNANRATGTITFEETRMETRSEVIIGPEGNGALPIPIQTQVAVPTGGRITVPDINDHRFAAELARRFGVSQSDVPRFLERTNIRMLQDQFAFLHGVDVDAIAPAEEMARAHLGQDASPEAIQAEARRIGAINDDVRQMFDDHGVLTAGRADQLVEWLETPAMRVANLLERQGQIIQMVGLCAAGETPELSEEEQELFQLVSERYQSIIPESARANPTQEQLEAVVGEVLRGFADAQDDPYLGENCMVDMHNPTLVSMQRDAVLIEYAESPAEDRPQILTLLRVQYALAVTSGDAEGRTADELRETLLALHDNPETWLENEGYRDILQQIERDIEQASADGPISQEHRELIVQIYLPELLDIDNAVVV